MSDYGYDEYGDTASTDDNDSNLVKKLRSKIEELSTRAKELEAENQHFKSTQRKQSLASILESRGYSPKLAAFVPPDLDVDEEKVDGWLSEYGDVFAGAKRGTDSDAPAATTVVANAADAEAVRRMNAVENNSQPAANVSGDILGAISEANSVEELMSVLRGA